jgi:DNA-binding NtrC family response regulator
LLQLRQKLCEIVDALVQAGLPLDQARREFERTYLIRALMRHGSRSKAAEALGIHRNTLMNRLRALEISPEDHRTGRGKRGSA